MTNKQVVESAEKTLTPIINEMGYDVVEIEYKKQYESMTLTIYIDNDSGITLDDCEKVSEAVSDILDEIDISQGQSYNLNVSSSGADRPLKTERDYRKNLGKEIEVKLFAPIKGQKTYKGMLKEFSSQQITIQLEKEDIKIEKTKIAKAVPVINF